MSFEPVVRRVASAAKVVPEVVSSTRAPQKTPVTLNSTGKDEVVITCFADLKPEIVSERNGIIHAIYPSDAINSWFRSVDEKYNEAMAACERLRRLGL